MNLIIDVGNTNVKLAVFDGDKLIEKHVIEHKNTLKAYNELIKSYDLKSGIISSVGEIDSNLIKDINNKIHLIILNSETKIPFKNLYKTPTTLGVDRLALISAAVKHLPNQNVLVIDAGTCITFDFINAKNNYLGGAISPGINLRYRALHDLTANLPLLEPTLPKTIIGNSTDSSMHSGVINGVIAEIEGIVKEYRKNHKHLTVILTGGDSDFLSKQLKNDIFANSNLLLEGLNHILEYNN